MALMEETKHLRIPFQDIKLATKNFTTIIGRGGYGRVYKGELSIFGKLTIVAVKRLDKNISGQGFKEFLTEIQLLSRYKHPNLISLLGFCEEGEEKVLIYEHAKRGSLDRYVSSNETTTSLTWKQRIKICIDAARGLDYLHSHVAENHRVIHRDIKSANILLDENWKAMIADLGLSKIGRANENDSYLITNASGTHGYCDPAYILTGILTKESDVYSFGVVLFEVLCGRMCYMNVNNEHRFLPQLAQRYYKEGKLNLIIDPNLKDHMDSVSMKEFSDIAYQCLLDDRKQRPSIGLVLQKLEKALDLQVPPYRMLRISKHEEAPATPPHPLSRMGDACSRMDLTAIHQILVLTHYIDDEGINELSFQEWTQQSREMLEARKRGDLAFREKEFRTAIDFYSEYIDWGLVKSPTVYARRSLCYLMCDEPDEALRDASEAQRVYPELSTALYMQAVALEKLDMHKDADDKLSEAAYLEDQKRAR